MKTFFFKSIVIAALMIFTLNVFAQVTANSTEYDGVYFQVGTNKFLEASEATSFRGYLKFSNANYLPTDFPKIQYSLSDEPSVIVDYIDRIVIKGAEYSSDNYVIAISPVQSVGAWYIFSASRQLYGVGGDNPNVRYVYTPQFLCSERFYRQERYDSITTKKSINIKIRKNPQTNATEIGLGSQMQSGDYVLWFWARSNNVNDKLFYFTYSPSVSQITSNGVYSKTLSGRYHQIPKLKTSDIYFISKGDSTKKTKSFLTYSDELPSNIPSLNKNNLSFIVNSNAISLAKHNLYIQKIDREYYSRSAAYVLKNFNGDQINEYKAKNSFTYYTPVITKDFTLQSSEVEAIKGTVINQTIVKLKEENLKSGYYAFIIEKKSGDIDSIYIFHVK